MLECFLFNFLFLNNFGIRIIRLTFKFCTPCDSFGDSWFSHQHFRVWFLLKIRFKGLDFQCGLYKAGLWYICNNCIQVINHILIFSVVNSHIIKNLQHKLFPFLYQCIVTCGINYFTKRVLASYAAVELRREPRTLMRGEKKSILLFWFKMNVIQWYQQCQYKD